MSIIDSFPPSANHLLPHSFPCSVVSGRENPACARGSLPFPPLVPSALLKEDSLYPHWAQEGPPT